MKGLRVKQQNLPLSASPILGDGVDVTKLPDGHLCCAQCGKFRMEAWVTMGKVTCGCVSCGHATALLFPTTVVMPSDGKFTCKKHPSAASIIISNHGIICIGCEKCKNEVRINVKEDGLIA